MRLVRKRETSSEAGASAAHTVARPFVVVYHRPDAPNRSKTAFR